MSCGLNTIPLTFKFTRSLCAANIRLVLQRTNSESVFCGYSWIIRQGAGINGVQREAVGIRVPIQISVYYATRPTQTVLLCVDLPECLPRSASKVCQHALVVRKETTRNWGVEMSSLHQFPNCDTRDCTI